jgi:hypothetical protein
MTNEVAVPETFKFNPKDIQVLEQRMTITRDFSHSFTFNDPHMQPIVYDRGTSYEVYVRFVVLNPELNLFAELMSLEEFGFYMIQHQINSGWDQIEHEVEFRFYPRYDHPTWSDDEPEELEDYKAIPE